MKKTTLGLDDEEDNVYDSYRYITYLTSGKKKKPIPKVVFKIFMAKKHWI